MNKVSTSKFIFFWIFTLLCSGFPLSSLLATPGVCSRSFEGLVKLSDNDIHKVLVIALFLIGIYLIFSGIGLVNLSGCLVRLGMPPDYPNTIARAFLYSQFRTDSNYSNTEQSREANIHFGLSSGSDSKHVIKTSNLRNHTDSHGNMYVLTLDGESKQKFRMAMQTAKARLILTIVSMMVIVCISYASFIVIEGCNVFLESNVVHFNGFGFDLLGYSSIIGSVLLLLFITLISTVILNAYYGSVLTLCIISWINFFGLIFFSIISIYSMKITDNNTRVKGIESVQFDWDVHIWGAAGGVLEIGTFMISSTAFHIILPGAFKMFPVNKANSSNVWFVTILLIFFIFSCITLSVFGITPSFPILSNGFELNSEGLGISWRILESRLGSNEVITVDLIRSVFLFGSIFTLVFFVSIVAKCVDNIIRSISNQVECSFDTLPSNKSSPNKKYFLRSAKQQVSRDEGANFNVGLHDDLIANQTGHRTSFEGLANTLRFLFDGDWLLDFARSSLNSVSAIGILLVINYLYVSEPQVIPIFRSVSISFFAVIVLILPCVVFWFVFYSEMVPKSASILQKMNLIFLGRISRNGRSYDTHRDKLITDRVGKNWSCNPLIFGFFSITIPIALGCTILIYEISKMVSLCLDLRLNAII
ncbi:putative signal peptide-containing and transmembrane domain-containing protein [Cryptosporidium canis]|uniref:Signal peptide-containing and transmembrane domain-containing protein n=1 Tax=Cryptosporidium canis TaxID=195482 RepID=A0A9D5DG51_9CRYT|nr:putative signal peptide-containing and transmembrane domain-containing protein [Cryptosporidium canis]